MRHSRLAEGEEDEATLAVSGTESAANTRSLARPPTFSLLAPPTRLKRAPTTAPPLCQTARSPTSASPKPKKEGRAARLLLRGSGRPSLPALLLAAPFPAVKELRNELGRSEWEGGGSP